MSCLQNFDKGTGKCCIKAEDLMKVCHTCPDNPIGIPGKVAELKKKATRSYNPGASDYAKHKIQPWDIWEEYNLNPWEADIVKRILRKNKRDTRKLDLEKIVHVATELIRQIDANLE